MAEWLKALVLKTSNVKAFVGSNPTTSVPHRGFTMSLISQKDRDLAIEALDFYLFNKKFDFTESKRGEINALINWIKLEKSKHEN